jgi:hypothetical protein
MRNSFTSTDSETASNARQELQETMPAARIVLRRLTAA